MKPDIGNIYQRLFDAYKKSHSTKSAGKAQEEVVIIWKDLKDKYKLQDDLVKKAEELISDYLNLSQKNKCNNILKFFTTQTSKSSALANQSQPSSSASNVESLTVSSLSPILTESSDHLKSISREDGKLYDEEISEASHLSTSKNNDFFVYCFGIQFKLPCNIIFL
ncbi:uncharacterized protein LOC122501961 [Leptopilina heterotoma]|uniref:uncharacterized protein LOC122501961 n=1 Tax=Leptopilina heterotoma TaxID=63436 RepID=UPI001CA816A2|nr:uncharacterized protein LOC122501961 [Leptopilina heterotoma]